jgi:hypothetical protein
VEILKPGSLGPPFVLDLLLQGKAAIPGVEVIGQCFGSRGIVIGFNADTVYAIRVGTTPSEVLLAAVQDLAWLKEEESLVQEVIFPRAARPFSGVLIVADLFPPDFAALLPLFSFPCRLFRWIGLRDQPFPSILFEPYPPQVAEVKAGPEGITEVEERFFSSW